LIVFFKKKRKEEKSAVVSIYTSNCPPSIVLLFFFFPSCVVSSLRSFFFLLPLYRSLLILTPSGVFSFLHFEMQTNEIEKRCQTTVRDLTNRFWPSLSFFE